MIKGDQGSDFLVVRFVCLFVVCLGLWWWGDVCLCFCCCCQVNRLLERQSQKLSQASKDKWENWSLSEKEGNTCHLPGLIFFKCLRKRDQDYSSSYQLCLFIRWEGCKEVIPHKGEDLLVQIFKVTKKYNVSLNVMHLSPGPNTMTSEMLEQLHEDEDSNNSRNMSVISKVL